MKNTSLFLISLGALTGLYALFFFDPSVSAGEMRVVNMQKLNFQTNLLIASGIVAIAGVILFVKRPAEIAPVVASAQSDHVAKYSRIPTEATSDQDGFAEAIRSENTAEMKRFIESKSVSPHGCNQHGRGWLQYAVVVGKIDACRVLLEHGSSPADKDKFGKSANEVASASENMEIRELLSKHNPAMVKM